MPSQPGRAPARPRAGWGAGWGAVAVVASVPLLAACRGTGGGQPPVLPEVGAANNGERAHRATQVLLDARSAFLAQPAVHAVGDLALPMGPLTVDLVLTRDGGVVGSLARGTRRLQVLRTVGGPDPAASVRGDAGLAAGLGATAAAQADFVAVPAGATAPIAALALPALADRLLPSPPAATPSPGLVLGDVDGARAVMVTVGGARVSVSDSGAPRLLRVAGGAAVPGVLELGTDVPTALPTLPAIPSPTPSAIPSPTPSPTP